MLVVWKFYCGLVEFTAQDGKFNELLQKTSGFQLFHSQCAYESQQSLPCTLVMSSCDHCLALRDENLTIPDFKALGYVLEQSLHPVKLQLANCNIKYNIEAMNHLLLQCSPNLTELDLSDNDLGDDGAKCLISGLEHCHNIKCVRLRRNALSVNGASIIFSSINCQNVLEVNSWDITNGNNIAMDEYLLFILPKFTNIQVLKISLHFTAIYLLLDTLRNNTMSLKELCISIHKGMPVSDYLTYYTWDTNTMPQIRNLLSVFHKHGICSEVAERFAEALSLCWNLQMLQIRV